MLRRIEFEAKPFWWFGRISYLALFLPHKVNVERSSAKWDAVTSTLIVTMPIVGRDLLSYKPG
jgi:hypothetical protein